MILMPQIFGVTANENGRYKRNELEFELKGVGDCGLVYGYFIFIEC